MRYSDLDQEQQKAAMDVAVALPTDCWPQEGESVDVDFCGIVVTLTYEEFYAGLGNYS